MLPALAILLYLTATTLQTLALLSKRQIKKTLILNIGLAATVLHGWLLYHWIDVGYGQNLTFFNMLSLVSWLIALLVALTAWYKPVENLSVPIFPIAAFSIVLAILFPSWQIIDTQAHPRQLWHILLAVVTFSVLSVAGLQAILLAILEQQLRSRPALNKLPQLPALETMETLLFQMIRCGFLLLTVLLASSLYFYYPTLRGDILQKTLLVIIAWLIFIWLLVGRHYLGWRGRKAIYGTLIGVSLLAIVYFGSQLFWEAHF